jgi:hypothetical protein
MAIQTKTSRWVLILGLLALMATALTAHAGDPGAGAHDASKAAPAPDAIDVCEQRLLQPFAESFGIAGPGDGRSVAEVQDEVALRLAFAGGLGGDVRFLVATVPDPIDAGLYYAFDRALEAIQGALESQGLLVDRSWLPWDDVQARGPGELERVKVCRRRVPGVVLFRAPAPRSLLVLFLVGETPVWGVHKAALGRALGFADRATEYVEPPIDARILGPTFSGSASSLRLALHEPWQGGLEPRRVRRFHIVSGSATDPGVKTALETGEGVTVDFHATVVPDDARQCAFFDYLHRDLGVPVHDAGVLEGVALLSEALTAYGNDFRTRTTCLRPAVELTFPPHISSVRRAYDTSAPAAPTASASAAPVVPPTQLAPVLDEPAEPRDAAPSLSPKTTSAHDLLLSTLMREVNRRNVRYLGVVATDPADTIFLAERIHLAAPDLRLFTFDSDVLYTHPSYAGALGGMLIVSPYPSFGAGEYTGGRIGAAAPHPMFEGESAEGAFNAALALLGGDHTPALADYQPLGPGSRLPLWISVVRRGATWPLAIRTYDALPDLVFEPRGGPPASRAAPGDELVIDPELVPPTLWQIVVLFASLFVLYNVMARASYERGPASGPSSPAFTPLSGLDERCHRWTPIKQRLYALFALSALFALHAHLILIDFAWLRSVGGAPGRSGPHLLIPDVVCAAGAVCLGLLVVTLASAVRSWARAIGDELRAAEPGARHPATALIRSAARFVADAGVFVARGEVRDERRWRIVDAAGRGAVAIGAAVGSAAWLGWLLLPARAAGDPGSLGDLHGAARVLFLERCVNVGSGVSPVVPLVAGGVCMYVWAIGHTSRLRLIEALRIDRAARPACTSIGRVLRDDAPDVALLDGRLVRALETPGLVGRGYLVALLAMTVVPLCAFFLKPITTLERGYGWPGLLGAILLSALASGSALIRLVFYWVRLQTLLRRLSRHPLASAFGRLPASRVRSVETQLSSGTTEVRELGAPVQQLRVLAKRLDLLEGEDRLRFSAIVTEDMVKKLGERAHIELVEEAVGRRPTEPGGARAPAAEPDLLDQLVAASAAVARGLSPFWYGTSPARAGSRETVPVETETTPVDNEPAKGDVAEPVVTSGLSSGAGLAAYGTGARSAGALGWLALAEELVATTIAIFLERALRQIRHFLMTIIASALCLLLVVATYPFQPQRLLMSFLWVVMGSAVGAGLYVFVQLDRDELLSRIAGTPAGHVTWNRELVLRVVTWGVIPLAGVAAAAYPDLGSGVLSWLEPLLKALE